MILVIVINAHLKTAKNPLKHFNYKSMVNDDHIELARRTTAPKITFNNNKINSMVV